MLREQCWIGHKNGVVLLVFHILNRFNKLAGRHYERWIVVVLSVKHSADYPVLCPQQDSCVYALSLRSYVIPFV